ncbi:sulfite exporter TauE/SafE family protein [Glycomyces xiaoerkulensis]|uniref:sulfite exporter TauE/SafE family protein n=1 Tax=Glycomyces xiaoerkulensis TaxID=2038139 RepID=UPI000C263E8F|nr:sulfite exporter TauE/SafE family protein [Glycomyces xiaoerkulensis]
MTVLEVLLLLLAGVGAGALNAVAGGGSLLTYPALLAVGVVPLHANATNAIAVAPAYTAAAIGSRQGLRGQRRRVLGLVPTAFTAGLAGTILLLNTPHHLFEDLVPLLVFVATALVAVGPWINRRVMALNGGRALHPIALHLGVGFGCLYGAYFNAALGLVLIAFISMCLPEALSRVGALKNAMTFIVGVVTTVVYGIFADIAWWAIAVLVPATFFGGYVGARLFVRIPDRPLRIGIVLYGFVLSVILLLR